MKTFFSTFALCFALTAAGSLSTQAQTLSAFGTDNRAQGIGELTDAEIAEALSKEGRVSMSGDFFATDSAEMTEKSSEVLFKLAKAMEEMPDVRLAVIGHTDSTGKFEYNIELSQRRAQAVVSALQGDPYNLSAERMVAVGVGPIDPVASNMSEEGRALNRRVTFVLIE